MKARIIATGQYVRLGAVAAATLEWATGLQVEQISAVPDYGLGTENAFAHKLFLSKDEQCVTADADIVFLRKFALPSVPLGTFAGAKAQLHESAVIDVCGRYGGDPRRFVNTGLFVADPSHEQAMRQALTWMRDGVSRLHEESLLNCALQATESPILYLPAHLNMQVIATMAGTGLHLCGFRGVEAKMREACHLIQNHAPAELRAFLDARGIQYTEPVFDPARLIPPR